MEFWSLEGIKSAVVPGSAVVPLPAESAVVAAVVVPEALCESEPALVSGSPVVGVELMPSVVSVASPVLAEPLPPVLSPVLSFLSSPQAGRVRARRDKIVSRSVMRRMIVEAWPRRSWRQASVMCDRS